MGKKTKIDWADSTWNPVTGCLHGCEYCYARKIAKRFDGKCGEFRIYELAAPIRFMEGWTDDNKPIFGKSQPYPFGFEPTFHKYRLGEPAKWTKQRTIFVCSMADLFGIWVPDEWIKRVFKACEKAPQHRYLFLTKNPKRFGYINGWNHQYDNAYAKDYMWFGTTITRQCELDRIRHLPYGNAHTFLSIEPILERIDLEGYLPTADARWRCSYCGHYANTYANRCGSCGRQGGYSGSFRKQPVNWIILGAESGNRKDKVIPRREWIDNIVQICDKHNIPVFMKESLQPMMGEDFRQEFPWV